MKRVLFFVLFIFLISINGVYADEQTMQLTGMQYASDVPVHYTFTVLGHEVILTKDTAAIDLLYSGYLTLPAHYEKHYTGAMTVYNFKALKLHFYFIGPKVFDWYCAGSYYNDSGTIRWYSNEYNDPNIINHNFIPKSDISSGIYFWKIVVLVTFSTYSITNYQTTEKVNVTYSFTVVPTFQNVIVLKYAETGNMIRDLESGITTSFAILYSVWTTTYQKIVAIDWGGTLMSFDFLGLIGDFLLLLGLLGYAVFQMFTIPITAISLIAATTTNTFTISMFMIAITLDVIMAMALWWAFWKIIILIKP